MVTFEKLKDSEGDNGIGDLEQLLGHELPEPYRNFLSEYNGAYVEPADFESLWYDNDGNEELMVAAVHYLYSGKDAATALNRVRERIPQNMLPIGQDPGGNLLLISVEPDASAGIHFWMNAYCPYGEDENTRVGEVASDFPSFIDGLFDESNY